MRLLPVLLLTATALCAAEPQFSEVFTAGQDGYVSIRIPSVVVGKKGTVGCLFEADNYARIVCARFPLGWLSEKP